MNYIWTLLPNTKIFSNIGWKHLLRGLGLLLHRECLMVLYVHRFVHVAVTLQCWPQGFFCFVFYMVEIQRLWWPLQKQLSFYFYCFTQMQSNIARNSFQKSKTETNRRNKQLRDTLCYCFAKGANKWFIIGVVRKRQDIHS